MTLHGADDSVGKSVSSEGGSVSFPQLFLVPTERISSRFSTDYVLSRFSLSRLNRKWGLTMLCHAPLCLHTEPTIQQARPHHRKKRVYLFHLFPHFAPPGHISSHCLLLVSASILTRAIPRSSSTKRFSRNSETHRFQPRRLKVCVLASL
jgi:hypothetical protein